VQWPSTHAIPVLHCAVDVHPPLGVGPLQAAVASESERASAR
jgi:hypothetical protein